MTHSVANTPATSQGRIPGLGHTLSFRQYLALLAIIVALPLIGLAYIVTDRVATAERQSTRAALASSARALASAVDGEIDRHIAVALTLSHSRALLAGDFKGFWERAKQTLSALPGSQIVLADRSGQQIVNTLRAYGDDLPTRGARDAQERAFATGQPQVSDVFVGAVSKRPSAAVEVPVLREGQPLYVISVLLDPERFRSLLGQQKFSAEWFVAVLDRKGLFLARHPDPDDDRTGQPASEGWRRAIAAAPEGFSDNVSIEGEPLVTAYSPTTRGWTVGVAMSTAALDAPIRQTRRLLLLVGVACLATILLLAWMIARRIGAGVSLLENAATAMGRKEPFAVGATGVREFDRLLAAFSEAASALRSHSDERGRAEATLAKRVTELAAIHRFTEKCLAASTLQEVFETALDTIMWALRSGRASILLSDQTGVMRFAASRGLSKEYRDAVEGHSPWAANERDPQPVCVSDIDGADLDDELKAVVAREGIRALAFIPLVAEGRLIGKFMTYHDVPHPFAEDELDLALTVARHLALNIARARADEAKLQAEKQRDLLVAELRHRVKNTLATIVAISRQSFAKTRSIEQARHSFEDRIRALAHTHARLADADWSGTSLETIVREETAPYEIEGATVRIAGPDVSLKPKQAVSVGMAMHELATNAAKYGGLSAKSGSLSVTWGIDAATGEVRLLWSETGGPAVQPPAHNGFGMLLLQRVLAADLDGRVDLDFAREGLTCAIAFPLERRITTLGDRAGLSRAPSTPPASQPTSGGDGGELRGTRIMIVEDEVFFGIQIHDDLAAAGCAPLGPYTSLAAASAAVRQEKFDFAVLDLNLNGELAYPLADDLTGRGIPFLFLTGYGAATLPERLRSARRIAKPYDPAALLKEIARMLGSPAVPAASGEGAPLAH